MEDLAQFFLLFEEWEVADHAATRAECCLGRTLDGYCDGIGPAPRPEAVAEAKRLRGMAVDRLREIKALVARARKNARVL